MALKICGHLRNLRKETEQVERGWRNGVRVQVRADHNVGWVPIRSTTHDEGRRSFRRHDEGDLGEQIEVILDPAIERRRASFRQADACALPPEIVGGKVWVRYLDPIVPIGDGSHAEKRTG